MFGLTEFQLFVTTMVVGGFVAACLFAGRQYRLNRETHVDIDPYLDLAPSSPALAAAREKFRDGGTLGFKEPDMATRHARRHPALDAPYGVGSGFTGLAARASEHRKSMLAARASERRKSIFLTPRQLERVNIQRRLGGRSPLNRAGFTNAVAHAWDQPIRQPDTSNDWLTYLILYECLFADHTSPRVGGTIGLTITPDAPYNGHGGEFAGAGASGSWTSPDASTAAAAAAIDTRAPVDPLSDPNSYKGSTDTQPGATGYNPDTNPNPHAEPPLPDAPSPVDTSGRESYGSGYSAPDTPSYSAPDTSSGYTPDTSSPSFDSTPSFDPGTSTI